MRLTRKNLSFCFFRLQLPRRPPRFVRGRGDSDRWRRMWWFLSNAFQNTIVTTTIYYLPTTIRSNGGRQLARWTLFLLRAPDASYRNSHNHINRGALYIMGNGENFKIIPKETYFYKANQPKYFFLLDKSELWKRGNWCTNWQNESTSLYFYLKSHIFELLQHTMEKNSTSRSGTTSNLYCLFGWQW